MTSVKTMERRLDAVLEPVTGRISRFFLAPASPRPLAVLRIGLASILIVQALLVSPDLLKFYAHDGLVQESLAPFFFEPWTPQISALAHVLGPLGFSETVVISGLGLAYLGSLVAMALGWHTRIACVAAWFLHWTFMASGSTSNYGVEIFAHVFLFYLMVMPAGDALSLDVAAGRAQERATPWARLSLRVLQLQLCIAYFSSGWEKMQGEGWWNGEALWRSLMLPDYNQYDFGWLSGFPILAMLGCWATLIVEIGYCVFIWPKASRRYWIAAVVGLHLGISIFLGLTLFGMIMCVLTLSIFGVPEDPALSIAPVRETPPVTPRDATVITQPMTLRSTT